MREWLLVLAVLVITGAVFFNGAGFAFVYDDHNQIENNPLIQSWRYLPTYFTSHVWSHKTSTAIYYRPIFLFWLLLNHSVFGLSSAAWHLSTLALHLIATLLVYCLARSLTGDRWVSLLSALVFGVYPAHVEAVDWVSGGTEPLFAVFFLASFLCYLRRWQATSLVLAALALLAKETGVVLPTIVFAHHWIFHPQPHSHRSRFATSATTALPYALVTSAYLATRTLALGAFASRVPFGSYADGFFTWPAVIAFYLHHLTLPVRLSVYYNLDLITQPGFRNFAVPLFEVLAASLLVWLGSRLSGRVSFLLAWMVLTLLPALTLTMFGTGELIHDRYLYVPSMAFCILLAMAVCQLKPRFVRVATATALFSICAWATVQEGRYWADGVALNERGLVIAPGNLLAMENLGVELMRSGRNSEAIAYFLQVLGRQPGSAENLFDLGVCYYRSDMFPEAERYLQRAIAADPQDPRAHLILGIAWGKQNRLEDAEREIRQSIALQRIPTGYKGYHLALGIALERKGDVGGALREFRQELINDPQSEEAAQAIIRIETRRR